MVLSCAVRERNTCRRRASMILFSSVLRQALYAAYGGRIERVVLLGSHAAGTHAGTPTTT
jgi:hypothetical protein